MSISPDPSPGSQLRIGDAERNAAAAALEQHLTSGRLTLDEYGDRSAVVANARTQGDIDRVFGDLPPVAGTGGAVTPSRPSSLAAPTTGSSAPAMRGGGNSRALLIGLVSAMPFIALILFFVTGLWYFFLLIPLVGAIFGPMINRDRNDGQNGGNG